MEARDSDWPITPLMLNPSLHLNIYVYCISSIIAYPLSLHGEEIFFLVVLVEHFIYVMIYIPIYPYTLEKWMRSKPSYELF